MKTMRTTNEPRRLDLSTKDSITIELTSIIIRRQSMIRVSRSTFRPSLPLSNQLPPPYVCLPIRPPLPLAYMYLIPLITTVQCRSPLTTVPYSSSSFHSHKSKTENPPHVSNDSPFPGHCRLQAHSGAKSLWLGVSPQKQMSPFSVAKK